MLRTIAPLTFSVYEGAMIATFADLNDSEILLAVDPPVAGTPGPAAPLLSLGRVLAASVTEWPMTLTPAQVGVLLPFLERFVEVGSPRPPVWDAVPDDPPLRMSAFLSDREFWTVEFEDYQSTRCSLAESSLATAAAIWWGCSFVKGRVHLDQARVAWLLPYLTRFAATGDPREPKETDG